MTRDELFKVFPRPWRIDQDVAGQILAADGRPVYEIDAASMLFDDERAAVAQLCVEFANEAKP
ncbi:MAG TPA: hypothetical protein VGF92_02815 [Stellaceae bacterium]|jgi:hypothetical protein